METGRAVVVQRLGKVQEATARPLAQLVVGPDQIHGLLSGQDFTGAGFFLNQRHGRHLRRRLAFVQPVIELAHRHFEGCGQFPDPRCGDPVGAAFVLLDLLEADSDGCGELLLGQSHQPATATKPLAEMKVNIVRHAAAPLEFHTSQHGTSTLARGKRRAAVPRAAELDMGMRWSPQPDHCTLADIPLTRLPLKCDGQEVARVGINYK